MPDSCDMGSNQTFCDRTVQPGRPVRARHQDEPARTSCLLALGRARTALGTPSCRGGTWRIILLDPCHCQDGRRKSGPHLPRPESASEESSRELVGTNSVDAIDLLLLLSPKS
jgi:hypothetical protein